MATVLAKRPGQRISRPDPAASMAAIRRMGYEGERQRQITSGQWARGHDNAANKEKYGSAWMPDLGAPDDVFVYLPMSAPHEREFFSDGHECKMEFPDGSRHVGCRQKYVMLSDVPNKRAVARRPSTGEFVVEPPEYDQLDEVMDLMRRQVPDSIAMIKAELEEIEEALKDGQSLMKGEAQQFRKIRKKLLEAIARLGEDATFDTTRIYKPMVMERMSVLKAQQGADATRHAELQREYNEWKEHLRLVDEAVPTTASTSSSKRSMSSTAPTEAS